MRSYIDVISDFGGPAQFARAIGIEPSHANVMKVRDSIAPAYWDAVAKAAAARGILGASIEDLASFRSQRSRRQGKRSEAAA